MLSSPYQIAAMAMPAVATTLLVFTPVGSTSAQSLDNFGSTSVCPPLVSTCPYNIAHPAWFAGSQVSEFVQTPNPTEPSTLTPSPSRPDTNLYLVGNIGSIPLNPEQTIPGGAVVPDHDVVWPIYPQTIYNGFGYWVVPGPSASTDSVRTRTEPANSLAGAPLAYQIRLGQDWVDLNNADLIKSEVQTNQLRLVELGYGGAGWFLLPQKKSVPESENLVGLLIAGAMSAGILRHKGKIKIDIV